MLDKLKQLHEVQSIDTRLADIEKSKEGLPEVVKEIKNGLEKKEIKLTELKADVEKSETSLKELNRGLEDSNTLLEKYKTQRQNVTNNKEYEALVNEIAYRENLIEESGKEKDSLGLEIKEINETIENLGKEISEMTVELSQKEEQLETKMKDTEEEEKKLLERKSELEKALGRQLFRLYARILQSKDNKAVVDGDAGHCEGCFTVLPAQKLSELKRANSIVQCDFCSRIITYGLKNSEEESA